VDLHHLQAAPTASERRAVETVTGPPTSRWDGGPRVSDPATHVAEGGRAVRDRRHLLLPALQAVQDEVGWVSEGAMAHICERLGVPPADAHGVASFYALLSLQRRPTKTLHVCDDLACRIAGAEGLVAEVAADLGSGGGGVAAWSRSPCLGLCEQAPAAFCQVAGERDRVLGAATIEGVRDLLSDDPPPPPDVTASAPQTAAPRDPGLRLLRRVGVVDPTSLDDYRAAGGYQALERALELGPGGVLQELEASRLLGRGGAAFPTAVKWRAVATTPARPHHVIANADESEPGTFKDRVLLEGDPYALIEALTIAGLATGAEQGWVYLRGEYPRAAERLTHAIAQARRHGLLGRDVLGSGLRFDVELRRGGGAYICGEETALMESIEGYRGEPRAKPPFPTQVGLFGKPTAVNNVETLYAVLDVMAEGGSAFAGRGTEASAGTKLFCVSGSVAVPGCYEVPFGTTVRELLTRAGGIPADRPLQALLLGGAAGGFVAPEHLDAQLTFEGMQAIGASLGSGVVMVLDDTVDIADLLLRIAAFFRDESCGQCVPCRVGTVRQEEALHRLVGGVARDSDPLLLTELAQVLRDASICGLGHTAPNALQSALALDLLRR
jgi:NADH-quinone oxidoreductase subunit F